MWRVLDEQVNKTVKGRTGEHTMVPKAFFCYVASLLDSGTRGRRDEMNWLLCDHEGVAAM